MFYLQKTISVFVLFCFALFFVFLCGGSGWGGEGCGLELGVSVFEQLTLPSSNFMDKVRNDGKPRSRLRGLLSRLVSSPAGYQRPSAEVKGVFKQIHLIEDALDLNFSPW